MRIISDRNELKDWVHSIKQQGLRIGLAPTMGNLHAGHMALIKQLQTLCDHTVCSIFVNPTQFGPNEDFARYPRTALADREKLEHAGCSLLFAPETTALYPQGTDPLTRVVVRTLENLWCGASRPGHFQGVATVVSKLFNLVQPDLACFGEKDYQQLTVIQNMVQDLDFPVEIHACPTLRENDGLAMSSRNQYLNETERHQAPMLYRTLTQIRTAIEGGMTDYRMLESSATGLLNKSGFQTDYFAIVDADTLQSAQPHTPKLRILVAARLGSTRLIDNLGLSLH